MCQKILITKDFNLNNSFLTTYRNLNKNQYINKTERGVALVTTVKYVEKKQIEIRSASMK